MGGERPRTAPSLLVRHNLVIFFCWIEGWLYKTPSFEVEEGRGGGAGGRGGEGGGRGAGRDHHLFCGLVGLVQVLLTPSLMPKLNIKYLFYSIISFSIVWVGQSE